MRYHDNFYLNDEPSKQVNPDHWGKIRANVYKRDDGICQVCFEKISWERYECGHIVDRVVGGSDAYTNVVVMCVLCNRLKPLHETKLACLDWVKAGGAMGGLERNMGEWL